MNCVVSANRGSVLAIKILVSIIKMTGTNIKLLVSTITHRNKYIHRDKYTHNERQYMHRVKLIHRNHTHIRRQTYIQTHIYTQKQTYTQRQSNTQRNGCTHRGELYNIRVGTLIRRRERRHSLLSSLLPPCSFHPSLPPIPPCPPASHVLCSAH